MNAFLSALPTHVKGAWNDSFGHYEFPTFKKWGLSVHDHVVPHARNNYHPHILSHRFIALVSIMAIVVKVASVSLVAFSPAAPTMASAISQETIINLTNQARVQNSLSNLQVSGLLTRAAQNKANDMLAKQYFAHNSPDGLTPWSFIKGVGYSYVTAGENLAIDFSEAEHVQAAWMNSPGHRANILNDAFKEIGIGIAKGLYNGHQTTIVVQMFGTPVAQAVEVNNEPTPVAPPVTATPAPTPVAPTEVTTGQPAAVNSEPVVAADPIVINETKTALQGEDLYIEISASSNVVKLMAHFGDSSVMFDPIADNLWNAHIPMSAVGPYDNIMIQASDLDGKLHQEPLAQFSYGLASDFSLGEVEGETVTVFGTEINPKIWEEKVFLIILAALIACLAIAIGVKRHIQHMSLIANTSFAAVLIAMLMLV